MPWLYRPLFFVISFFDFYGHIAYGHSRLPQLSLQGFGRPIFNSLKLHDKQAIYPENFLNGSLIAAMVSPSHAPPASIQNTYTSIRIIFRGPAGIRHLCAQTNTWKQDQPYINSLFTAACSAMYGPSFPWLPCYCMPLFASCSPNFPSAWTKTSICSCR